MWTSDRLSGSCCPRCKSLMGDLTTKSERQRRSFDQYRRARFCYGVVMRCKWVPDGMCLKSFRMVRGGQSSRHLNTLADRLLKNRAETWETSYLLLIVGVWIEEYGNPALSADQSFGICPGGRLTWVSGWGNPATWKMFSCRKQSKVVLWRLSVSS